MHRISVFLVGENFAGPPFIDKQIYLLQTSRKNIFYTSKNLLICNGCTNTVCYVVTSNIPDIDKQVGWDIPLPVVNHYIMQSSLVFGPRSKLRWIVCTVCRQEIIFFNKTLGCSRYILCLIFLHNTLKIILMVKNKD